MADDISGTGPPYLRIAGALRGEILSGELVTGAQLPTQQALVHRFNVSRATVVRALDELREGGYIDSQQGRGSYVLTRTPNQSVTGPAGVLLAQHLAQAFTEPKVTIDVYSLTCETLIGALQTQIERVRAGELRPQSIRLRLLLPASGAPLAVPRSLTDTDDIRPTQRFRRLAASQVGSVESLIEGLHDLNLVKEATVEIKGLAVTPLHKLYLLNGSEALFGHYEVVERPVSYRGVDMDIYDVLGLGATLFHFSADAGGAMGAEFVERSKSWFDSLWTTIAEPWEW